MSTTIQIISGIVQTGAISFLVYMIIKGLKVEIKTLQKNITAQNETIKTMDKRIEETEKIGDLYKRLISDFPQAIDDYQAVITKTKDSTIYELKSKVEEQNQAIELLREISKKGDIQTSKRASLIGTFFLDKKNKSIIQFIQNLEPNKDLAFKAMIENSNFNAFLTSLEKEVKYSNEEEIRDPFSPEFMKKNNARNITFNRIGAYIITFDNKLIIPERLFNIFKDEYESL